MLLETVYAVFDGIAERRGALSIALRTNFGWHRKRLILTASALQGYSRWKQSAIRTLP